MACACGSVPQGNAVDIDAAALRAQHNIDDQARSAPGKAVPAFVAKRSSERASANAAADPINAPEVDAATARAVVARFFAATIAGQSGEAQSLWNDGGAAGKTATPFDAATAEIGRFASLHATVGAPFDADAGAGQRHISVPVRLEGARDGRPVATDATATLHRVAEGIDGATAAQRRWRIARIEIAPMPDAPERATATYRCGNGQVATVRFDQANNALLMIDGRTALLAAKRAASGIWYEGDGYVLRGKGHSVDLTVPNAAAVACTAD